MPTTLEQIQQLRRDLPAAMPENLELREAMMNEARKLMIDLERPDNTLVESVMVDSAIKMGLFKAINTAPSSTSHELAQQCNADPVLTAHGDITEVGQDSFGPSAVSRTFAERRNEVGVLCWYALRALSRSPSADQPSMGFLARGWLAVPQFLQDRQWQKAGTPEDTPMVAAHEGRYSSFWDALKASPAAPEFKEFMGSFNDGHKEWTNIYPIVERLGHGASSEPDAVFMVDVGGGMGHQAINCKKRFPQLLGRFVVQDLAMSLPSEGKRTKDVEFQVHDFFTKQPIHGARLYYLRYVPHNWPQSSVIKMCTLLREAMKKGYSKLIVNEWVVPESGAPRFMTALDIVMMLPGGIVRTETLHRDYLEKAGLKVNQIFHPGDNISEAVIECEVA